jgi:ureidoacrylate peracid hydrolase
MDPKKTAVVLIEYQNDFTSEGGTLHQAVKPVMDATNMLANTVETVEKARALGATIVFAPITFTEDYHELSSEPYGILKGVVDSKSFRKGTWGAEIVDMLKPRPEDIVIEGKRGLCGFASTNLDFVLRSRGITDIALGGFLTNCCVESTMRTGYEKVTLIDCTAALSEEEQRLAVAKNYPMFSRPLSHIEFLAELAGKAAGAGNSRGYEAASAGGSGRAMVGEVIGLYGAELTISHVAKNWNDVSSFVEFLVDRRCDHANGYARL